jgi:hypothetical protein
MEEGSDRLPRIPIALEFGFRAMDKLIANPKTFVPELHGSIMLARLWTQQERPTEVQRGDPRVSQGAGVSGNSHAASCGGKSNMITKGKLGISLLRLETRLAPNIAYESLWAGVSFLSGAPRPGAVERGRRAGHGALRP